MMLRRFLPIAKRRSEYLEFRLVNGPFTHIQIKDRESTILSNERFGFSVRALVDGSWGFSSSNRPSDLEKCVRDAVSLARISKGKTKLSPQKATSESVTSPVSSDPTSIDIDDKVARLLGLEKAMDGASSTTLNYVDWKLTTDFANSDGSCVSQESTRVFLSLTAIARRGKLIQSASERISSSTGYEPVTRALPLAESASRRARALLDASLPPSGKSNVIMDGMVTGLLCHEVVGHACEADAHMSHNSIFEGKLGKKLAPGIINIVDDPTPSWGAGSYVYDDEGVKARKNHLIKNGVLFSLLHSRETAREFRAQPTGNARAGGYSGEPIVRMSNTYMERGDAATEEIFDVRKAIYAKGFKGGSVTTKTGDFVFSAEEGWLIEKGEKKKRLRDILLAGNISQTLANIRLVGRDFTHSPGFCGKMGQSVPVSDGGPHVLVSDMVVGGQ